MTTGDAGFDRTGNAEFRETEDPAHDEIMNPGHRETGSEGRDETANEELRRTGGTVHRASREAELLASRDTELRETRAPGHSEPQNAGRFQTGNANLGEIGDAGHDEAQNAQHFQTGDAELSEAGGAELRGTGDVGVRGVARAIAEAVRVGSGVGWSVATVQVWGGGGAFSWNSWTDLESRTSVDLTSFTDVLLGFSPGVVEVRVWRTGAYAFAWCSQFDEVSNGQVILDQGYRYPGHPAPGMPRPSGTEPTGAATDLVLSGEIGDLAGEFAGRYTEIVGHAPEWPAACSEEELAAAEVRMGVRLPEDVRALYLVADGDFAETGLLGRYSLFSLVEVVEEYLEGGEGSYGWEDDLSDDGVVFETVPFGWVKRVSRNDFWVTVGSDRAGNYIAVDLDPAEHGQVGQVIKYGRDIYGPVEYVSTSVRTILTEVVAALRAGKYEVYGNGYLRADVHQEQARSHDEVINDMVDLAGITANQPELVQEIFLNDLADVDLAILEPLTSLRLLSLNRGQRVTPSISGLKALESLQINAREVDLTALAGQQTLWYVQLEDVVEPLDLTPLRTLPQLVRLDVAGSAVQNLDLICDMPNLRVLRLDAEQLRHLLDCGKPLPTLAALYISGQTYLQDTVDLANRLFGKNITVTEFSGSLT